MKNTVYFDRLLKRIENEKLVCLVWNRTIIDVAYTQDYFYNCGAKLPRKYKIIPLKQCVDEGIFIHAKILTKANHLCY